MEQDKSRIEELKKALYSRGAPDIRTKRRLRFFSDQNDIKTDWEHPPEVYEEAELNKKYKDTSMSFFKKLLVFSIIVFICALGIGAYLVFNGSNIVSANNIDISIKGPISVSGGEPVSFDVQVSNRNNIKLETVDLSIDFPAGTVDVNDTTKELKTFRELIPDIESGGIGQKTIQAVVYGEENSKKEIKVTVEYRVKGSSSVFKKQKSFDLLISSSPLSLSIDSYKEVNSGQEFEITTTMTSNSKEIIKNLILKAVYPFGFSYISSDLKPINGNNVWKIGDIPPGGKKTIKIKGKLEGQDDETRVFRFNTGAQSVRNEGQIGTEFISGTQEISIKKPFISVKIAIAGDSDLQEYLGQFDKSMRVDISYFNNLTTSIIDGEIKVKLSGSAFDKMSVDAGDGLYKSTTNEIIWNTINTPELRDIPAGGNGTISFNITPKNLSTTLKPIINPDITISTNIQGKRNSENDVPESIVSSANKHIKVSSNVYVSGQVLRSSGTFENTGPIPPKAEKQTTYNIVWTIDNTSNSVSNAQVISSLPPYVKWLGKYSPATEDITYNSVDGSITWNIGNLDTYTLNRSKRRQVEFQISLTPTIDQISSSPRIVGESTLTAHDDFTNETLNSTLSPLTTRFSTDPSFKDGDEIVSK